ncbi:hypothetical protein D3P05_14900 [Paracoccus siganidrum]|uniref:Uncharacterized protein n=1 Tax=Paracoccus siganidrum TaxID=1276757 RepID=A0A419A4B5_9RHOB|nr:hypothetical protein D3P05_14900 [Paracoccus siganidrum]
MLERLGRGRGAPDRPGGAIVPAELVAAITRSRIRVSPRPDGEGNLIVSVSSPILGAFRWRGIEDAAERIAATYPDLGRAATDRAARLLEAEVGDRLIIAILREPPRSWVWDF